MKIFLTFDIFRIKHNPSSEWIYATGGGVAERIVIHYSLDGLNLNLHMTSVVLLIILKVLKYVIGTLIAYLLIILLKFLILKLMLYLITLT